jgi:hypothetical protein
MGGHGEEGRPTVLPEVTMQKILLIIDMLVEHFGDAIRRQGVDMGRLEP